MAASIRACSSGASRAILATAASYRIGEGRAFVIEGDEYDSAFFDKTAKFLKYLPDIAVINNIEFDHADIYADLDAIRLAFRRLVNLVPRSGLTLLGADSDDALAMKKYALSRVESFGLSEAADWRAGEIYVSTQGQTFTVWRGRDRFATVVLPLSGAHNVRNALAAIALAHAAGIPADTIAA